VNRVQYVKPAEETELRLLNECLVHLRARRKLVYIVVAAAFVLAVGAAVTAPRTYPAFAKVMPSPTSSAGSSFGALIPGAAILSQMTTQVNLYMELLKSTHVQDSVLARYGIDPRRKQKAGDRLPCGRTVETIADAVSDAGFSASMKSGVVTLTMRTPDPQLSADLANAFVNCLDERLQELDRTLAAKTSGYLAGQIVEQRDRLQDVEAKEEEFLARNRNYMSSDDPQLRVEMQRAELEVQFNRELLKTLLELKARNDLELEKSIPRLMVVEWASAPQPQFPFERIKLALLAVIGAGVFAVGLVVLRAMYLWYIPPTTRDELAQSCASLGIDARRVVNRIRRPVKVPERSGV